MAALLTPPPVETVWDDVLPNAPGAYRDASGEFELENPGRGLDSPRKLHFFVLCILGFRSSQSLGVGKRLHVHGVPALECDAKRRRRASFFGECHGIG